MDKRDITDVTDVTDVTDNLPAQVLPLRAPQREGEALATVYALDDPRTGQARYVGATMQDPAGRLADHLRETRRDGRGQKAKRAWIAELKATGLTPQLRVLETVPWTQKDAAEQRWMRALSAQGADLLNVQRPHDALDQQSPQHAEQEELITPSVAALLLGVSERTARRYITAGRLPGHREAIAPGKLEWRTTRQAVADLLAQSEAPEHHGPAAAARTDSADGPDSPDGPPLPASAAWLAEVLRAQLKESQNTIERLAREVGRLEAELALLRGQGASLGGRGQRENGQRAGLLGRVGLWLRRS